MHVARGVLLIAILSVLQRVPMIAHINVHIHAPAIVLTTAIGLVLMIAQPHVNTLVKQPVREDAISHAQVVVKDGANLLVAKTNGRHNYKRAFRYRYA